MKVMMIKIETYHQMNIFTKLNFLENIITNLQKSDAWKSQLTIAINFISLKHVEEEREIHSSKQSDSLSHFVQYIKEIQNH